MEDSVNPKVDFNTRRASGKKKSARKKITRVEESNSNKH